MIVLKQTMPLRVEESDTFAQFLSVLMQSPVTKCSYSDYSYNWTLTASWNGLLNNAGLLFCQVGNHFETNNYMSPEDETIRVVPSRCLIGAH